MATQAELTEMALMYKEALENGFNVSATGQPLQDLALEILREIAKLRQQDGYNPGDFSLLFERVLDRCETIIAIEILKLAGTANCGDSETLKLRSLRARRLAQIGDELISLGSSHGGFGLTLARLKKEWMPEQIPAN